MANFKEEDRKILLTDTSTEALPFVPFETSTATFSMETRKLHPTEYGNSEQERFVRVSSVDNFPGYPLFSSEGYSIIPFYKQSGMPLTDYTKAQARGDLVRCSSATDVALGITPQQELGQCCLYGSLDTAFRISAADAPFILGSQDKLDFFLMPTRKESDQSVTAWRIPKLK